MLNLFLTPIIALACAVAYRLRGGGWLAIGDWQVRLIWGTSLFVAYTLSHLAAPLWAYSLGIWALAYVSMLIPHAYCMNMGRWPQPQNKWPSFFLPTWTQAEWTGMPAWCRTLNDFVQMASVAFLRATLVFAPLVAITYLTSHQIAYEGVLRGVAILAVGQPLGYVIGWAFPLNFPSLTKYSTEWGEFFNGLVWGIAMVQI